MNSASLAFNDAISGMPGIAVFERNVTFANGGRRIEVTEPEFRVALVGDTPILEWSAAGAPLD